MAPRQFDVSAPPVVLDQLREAVRQAAAHGLGPQSLTAARKILDGLRWLADELGESRRPLRVMGELRCVTILPITAWFAVHVGRGEVHIGRYKFVEPHPRA